MGILLIWIIVIFLLYKFWQLGHWFLFVNVDEKGQDPVERFINNVFNRIYAQQEKMIMTNIRNKMTPDERKEAEKLEKRMEQYTKDAEKIKEDLKSRKY